MAENSFSSFYTDLLEDDPQKAYMGSIPFASFNWQQMTQPKRNVKDYWSNQYANIFNEYQGLEGNRLRQMAEGGSAPQYQSFQQILQNTPFTERYGALTPQQKGKGIRGFAPSTRHIYF